MLIIFFSIAILLLGLGLGYRFPRSGFWEWVDVIYYPLAIFGVLLLFFDSVSIRKLAALDDQRRGLSVRISDIENSRPELSAQLSGRALVRAGGELLETISRLDRICAERPSRITIADPNCFVVRRMAPIVSTGVQALLTYEEPEDLGTVCDTASRVFSELVEESNLPDFIVREIAANYFEWFNEGFLPFEFDAVRRSVDDLRLRLEDDASNTIEALRMSEDDERWILHFYRATIQYGLVVVTAFEPCLRAPQSIRSGVYTSWISDLRNAQSELELREEDIQQLIMAANDLNPSKVFLASYWPFLICFALSLKFSKGVAALRKKHVGA